MYNWIMQLDRQYQANRLTYTENPLEAAEVLATFEREVKYRLPEYLFWIISQLFLPQLYRLQPNDKLILHIRAQAEENSYETKNEFVEFVENCFALAKVILKQLPDKNLQLEKIQKADDKVDHEKLAIKTTFILNLLSMSIKTEDQSRESYNRRYLTDFLQNTCVPLQDIQAYPGYNDA